MGRHLWDQETLSAGDAHTRSLDRTRGTHPARESMREAAAGRSEGGVRSAEPVYETIFGGHSLPLYKSLS